MKTAGSGKKATMLAIIVVIMFFVLVLQFYDYSSLSSSKDLAIANLQSNSSSLTSQVSSLRNQSAIQRWQLFVASGFAFVNVTGFAYNQTITVPFNATYLIATDPNGYNGVLRFDYSSPGCPWTGPKVVTGNGSVGYYFILNYYSPFAVYSFNVNSSPFSIYFQNTGPRSVTCGFTLTYVYNDS